MNRESIEKRLAELRQELDRIQANGNALIGAIQDCEYWLSQMDKSEQADLGVPSKPKVDKPAESDQ